MNADDIRTQLEALDPEQHGALRRMFERRLKELDAGVQITSATNYDDGDKGRDDRQAGVPPGVNKVDDEPVPVSLNEEMDQGGNRRETGSPVPGVKDQGSAVSEDYEVLPQNTGRVERDGQEAPANETGNKSPEDCRSQPDFVNCPEDESAFSKKVEPMRSTVTVPSGAPLPRTNHLQQNTVPLVAHKPKPLPVSRVADTVQTGDVSRKAESVSQNNAPKKQVGAAGKKMKVLRPAMVTQTAIESPPSSGNTQIGQEALRSTKVPQKNQKSRPARVVVKEEKSQQQKKVAETDNAGDSESNTLLWIVGGIIAWKFLTRKKSKDVCSKPVQTDQDKRRNIQDGKSVQPRAKCIWAINDVVLPPHFHR